MTTLGASRRVSARAALRAASTRRGPDARRGFTLVEAITTMVILSVLAAITSRIVFSAMDGYAAAATRAELVAAGTAAMERMTAELQGIPMRSGASQAEPDLVSVTPTSVAWTGSNSISLSGSTLNLTLSGVTYTLAKDVGDFAVQAYDQNNAALADNLSGTACSPVRRISLTLMFNRSGVKDTLRSQVHFRCTVAAAAP